MPDTVSRISLLNKLTAEKKDVLELRVMTRDMSNPVRVYKLFIAFIAFADLRKPGAKASCGRGFCLL